MLYLYGNALGWAVWVFVGNNEALSRGSPHTRKKLNRPADYIETKLYEVADVAST